MGQDTVYQLLGFVVVISKKCISIATLFCCLWRIVSSILFVGTAVFLQCTWISPKCLRPWLFVTCSTFYAFIGLSFCILCFLFMIISMWRVGIGTTDVKWLALRHVVLALSFVSWSLDLLVYVVSGWKLSTISLIFIVGLPLVDTMGLPVALFCLFWIYQLYITF